jgi:hypothetical protein
MKERFGRDRMSSIIVDPFPSRSIPLRQATWFRTAVIPPLLFALLDSLESLWL